MTCSKGQENLNVFWSSEEVGRNIKGFVEDKSGASFGPIPWNEYSYIPGPLSLTSMQIKLSLIGIEPLFAHPPVCCIESYRIIPSCYTSLSTRPLPDDLTTQHGINPY